MQQTDIIIIGAGAAGLFAAAIAGQRGRRVIVLDQAKRPGKKILISGGGRCNFTNYHIEPSRYLSNNPHFCKSALKQYSQWDFIALVEKHRIAYHEKTLGQLFCDHSAKEIVTMLMSECEQYHVGFRFENTIKQIKQIEAGRFHIQTSHGNYDSESLIIASGGLSMPKLGATPFAYQVAEQFGLNILPTRAGLVPLTLPIKLKEQLTEVSGISSPICASTDAMAFTEDMLITHRGLSGPAILQISSYWRPGELININLLPERDPLQLITQAISTQPNILLKSFLAQLFAKRFAEQLLSIFNLPNVPIKQLSQQHIQQLTNQLQHWSIRPSGSEGYRTAEVTLGGVDTNELSSKTMAVKSVTGLYFIGEAVDVSGWLGGYNFQWAWSSGWVAGQNA